MRFLSGWKNNSNRHHNSVLRTRGMLQTECVMKAVRMSARTARWFISIFVEHNEIRTCNGQNKRKWGRKRKRYRNQGIKKVFTRGTSLEPLLSRNMETMHKTAKIRTTKTIHKEGVGALRGTPWSLTQENHRKGKRKNCFPWGYRRLKNQLWNALS